MSPYRSNQTVISNEFGSLTPCSQQYIQHSTQYYQPVQIGTNSGVPPLLSSCNKTFTDVTPTVLQNSAKLQSPEYVQSSIPKMTPPVQNFGTQTPAFTNVAPSMRTYGTQTPAQVQVPLAQASKPNAPTYNSLTTTNTSIDGSSNQTPSMQNFNCQTAVTLQPPITQIALPIGLTTTNTSIGGTSNQMQTMQNFSSQTPVTIQPPRQQVALLMGLTTTNTSVDGISNQMPTMQHFSCQTPVTTQPPRTQIALPMANYQMPVLKPLSIGYPYNIPVGAKAQNSFQINACPTARMPNQQDAQQSNLATTVPTWSMPVRANQIPANAIQPVQVPSTVLFQPSVLQNTTTANNIPSLTAISSTPMNQNYLPQSTTSCNKKEVHPDNFDGSEKTEWSDYLVHFEQCAKWNQWSDAQKAQMLSIHLRGEAQRLLSGLTVAQLGNFNAIKQILSDRYEPKEKDVAFRCQFRYRKREKGENASDYGYHLNRLAQKAYPNLTLSQLEVHVIDQFITGLNNYDLQKHVQFGHPKTLNEAISLATEYEALESSVDRIKKPKADVETVARIVTHGSDKQFAENITMEQLHKLIEKKLNLLTASSRSRSKSPSASFKQEQNATKSEPKSKAMGKQTPKSELYCNYCKRNNHNIENCRTRKYHEKRRAEQPKQPGSDAAYLITTQEKQ